MATTLTSSHPVRRYRPARAAQIEGAETAVELRAGHLWRAGGNNCWRAIICREGVVWITQDGDVHDHVIAAGEMFLISQPGKVIAQALVDTLIEITPCLASPSFWGRFEDTVFQ